MGLRSSCDVSMPAHCWMWSVAVSRRSCSVSCLEFGKAAAVAGSSTAPPVSENPPTYNAISTWFFGQSHRPCVAGRLALDNVVGCTESLIDFQSCPSKIYACHIRRSCDKHRQCLGLWPGQCDGLQNVSDIRCRYDAQCGGLTGFQVKKPLPRRTC